MSHTAMESALISKFCKVLIALNAFREYVEAWEAEKDAHPEGTIGEKWKAAVKAMREVFPRDKCSDSTKSVLG